MGSRVLLRRLGGGLILGFVVFLAILIAGDLRLVIRQVRSFHWVLFPAVLALTLFNYALRFVKWHFYIQQVGVRDFPLWGSARLFVAGFPLAVTPAKAGEALKAVWLRRESGLPVATGIAVVIAERVSDGIAVLLLSTLGVVAYPQYWPAFALLLGALLALVIGSQVRPLALRVLSWIGRVPLLGHLAPRLGEFYEGSFALFRPRATFTAVGLGAISWLGEGVGFYLILLGLGIPPSWELASLAVFVLAFSTAVGAASTLPGGLGAAEISIAGMLVGLAHLTMDTAAVATLLIRLATLWFGVSLGLVVWLFSADLLALESNKPQPGEALRT